MVVVAASSGNHRGGEIDGCRGRDQGRDYNTTCIRLGLRLAREAGLG